VLTGYRGNERRAPLRVLWINALNARRTDDVRGAVHNPVVAHLQFDDWIRDVSRLAIDRERAFTLE
jgi:hypothetical protein